MSEDTVFLTAPRFLNLPKAKTKVGLELRSPRQARLTFVSPVFQHRFAFELPGVPHRASDNYFELYPREKKTVILDFARPVTAARLREVLQWRSLADTC